MDRGTNYGGELLAGLMERAIQIMVKKILNLSFFSWVRYPEKKKTKKQKTNKNEKRHVLYAPLGYIHSMNLIESLHVK